MLRQLIREGLGVSVSYTHLDVYKRQVHQDGFCTEHFRHFRQYAGTASVSYTHLDVYKRQPITHHLSLILLPSISWGISAEWRVWRCV